MTHKFKREKYLAPIFGLKNSPKAKIVLDKVVSIRDLDLFNREDKLFYSWGVRVSCDAVAEIEYEYNLADPTEPFPGLFLKIINKLDAGLVVYGDGKVGVAAVFPAKKDEIRGGGILASSNPQYEEKMDRELDENFATWYRKFVKAYDIRPLAFDIFRRSQERYANNDKTIDSCTVLESIFVPKGERNKKTYILNGMKIMAFNQEEVNYIEGLVEYRNAIIHADRDKILKLLGGKKYTYIWFEDAFKLVRKILYQYSENPWD